MLSATDARARAAGLFIAGAGLVAPRAAPAAPDRAVCADDKPCIDPLAQVRSGGDAAASDSSRDQLARLAAESRDPVIYALAMRRCAATSGPTSGGAGACQLLSLEQWATVDPDNAVPWLLQAERMQAARSPRVDVAEAMFRVAHSKHLKTYWAELLPLVMAAQPPGTPPLDRTLLAVDLAGLQAAGPIPMGGVPQFCSATALTDANRRETCEAITELFANRSDSMVYPIVATRLGQRLGWPSERIAPLRDEIDAGFYFQIQRASGSEPMSCQGVEAMLNHLTEVGRVGEREALRAALRRTGTNVEEMARRFREGLQASQRAANTTAAPDGAASAPPK